MALSLQDPVFVFQKVEHTLDHLKSSGLAKKAFLGLRETLVAKNIQLQFIPFSGSTTDVVGINQNTGYSPIGGVASHVYALYIKNDGTGDGTDAYIRVYNETSNTTNTNAFITGVIQDDNDEFFSMKHDGWSYPTDVTISGDTGTDATESTAARSGNGFIVLGA